MFNSGNCGMVPVTMDVAPVGYANNGNNNNGWGGDSWIIWLFFILAIFWGGNGFGNNNGNGSNGSVMDAYVLNSDFATLQRQIDSGFAGVTAGINQVNNGLCQGFYQQAQLVNGVQMQVANEFRGVDNAVCTLGYNMQSGINSIANQLASCCCDLRSGLKDIQFQNAQDTCATTTAVANAARDIIDSQNANYRALHDEIVANRIEDKNAQIAAQQQQIFQLQLAASQQEQNNYLVNQLRPCPIPSYQTCNPWASTYNYGYNGCSGCGCGA